MKRELHTIRYSFSPSEIAQKSTQLADFYQGVLYDTLALEDSDRQLDMLN